MKKGIKGIIFSLIFCIAVSAIAPITASAAWTPSTIPTCKSIYLVNSDTGTVVYEKNAHTKIYPASITKLMTAILVYDKFKNNLDKIVTVQSSDIALLYGTDSSTAGLVAGEKLSVKQLLYSLLIASGSDCANVLARETAGSVDKFVGMMNKKAKDMGLKGTHYINPHGLHDSNHYTTAYDVYLLSRYAMKIPLLAKIVDTVKYTLKDNKTSGREFTNTNYLLDQYYQTLYYYQYAKGIKTGTTTPAGYCLTSYAEKDGVTYYCVAMGANIKSIYNTAFQETRSLYEWAFGDFEITPVVKTTDAAASTKVDLSAGNATVQLVPKSQLNALVASSAFSQSDVKRTPHVPKSVTAPVKKGQQIGYEDVYVKNSQTHKYEKVGSVKLVTSEKVDRSTPLYVLSLISKFFGSVWFKIVAVLLVILLVLYISLSVYINHRRKMINSRRRGRGYKYRRRR